MARLTWQNVEAPDLGRAADILNAAANQIGAGGSSIAGAARQAREDQMNRRSAAALPLLAGIQSSGDVAGALAQIGGVVRPEDMNEETRQAVLGLMGRGLDFDRSRAGTTAVSDANNRANTETNRQWTREDQEAQLAGEIIRAKEGAYAAGVGGGNLTLDVIRKHEGFRDTPYWDVNALRTGYGSDTVTLADGTIKTVTEGMQISREDAERDLQRRVNTEFMPEAAKAVGEELFASLPENQKAALTSITYNYGSLPSSVAKAVQSGDPVAVASAINALGVHNNGVNARRRREEAELYLGGGFVPSAGGVANLIPENNLLGMSFWDDQSDDYRAQEQEGYGVGRARRADYEADLAKAVTASMQEAALTVAGRVEDPNDLVAEAVRYAKENNLSVPLQQELMTALQDPTVAAQFAVGSETTIPTTGLAAGAQKSLDLHTMRVDEFVNQDPTLRIQTNAEQYSSDPALKLTEKMGLTADDRGTSLEAIQSLVNEAKGEGINLSPSEAASLLYESAERAGFTAAFVPGFKQWGQVYFRPDDALAMAKSYMTPEQRQKGNEIALQVRESQAVTTKLQDQMSAIDRKIAVAAERGNQERVDELRNDRKELEEAAINIGRSHGAFLPKAEPRTNRTVTSQPGVASAATEAARGQTSTGGASPDAALQRAALAVASGALAQGTGGVVTLERLQGEPPAVQLDILQSALRNLKQEGGSAEQISAIEMLIEQVAPVGIN